MVSSAKRRLNVLRRLGFQIRRNRQTPQTVFRNAFLVTFIIFLAVYPLLDKSFGWGKMGAFPTILIYTLLALVFVLELALDLRYAAFSPSAAIRQHSSSPRALAVFLTNFCMAMDRVRSAAFA
jgi:hypothetical protein